MKFFNIPQNPKVLIFDIDSTLYTCPEYAHEQIDSQVRHWAALNKMSAETARKMVAEYRRKWAIDHDGQKISLGNLFTAFGVPIETSIEWRKKLFDPKKYLKRDENLILALEKLGGMAKLGQLYKNVDVSKWMTKTPFASIRRIVQTNKEFSKIKSGIWH